MSNKREKAKIAKDFLRSSEESSKAAKEIFVEIGDPEGEKKAGKAERISREAKEYVETRLS
jgi:hypothetical protein